MIDKDITYCYYADCPNKACYCHQCNIKDKHFPYWFGLFEHCKYWKMPETKGVKNGNSHNNTRSK